jgi:hypothetical protein
MYAIRIQFHRSRSAHGDLTATVLRAALHEDLAQADPAPCSLEELVSRADEDAGLVEAIAFVQAPSLLGAETAVRRACLEASARQPAFLGWTLSCCEADFILTVKLP